nr:hypothetical protein [uncultured Dysosmobacter sp.]
MDRDAKKLLNSLIKFKKGTGYICVFDAAWESMGDSTIEDFSKMLGYRIEDTRAAVHFLESN